MKSTGIVRNIDELGRIVIPKEIRKKLEIKSADPIEIYVDGSNIILSKCASYCHFCDGELDITEFKGKKICRTCLDELRNTEN